VAEPRWLGVHRHRIRGFGAPFLLILQNPVVESATRIAAPVIPAGPGPATLLAPAVRIGGEGFRAILLDMTAVPQSLLREAVAREVAEEAVAAALDAIFRGYPVGLPLR
jgi:hypothetical protein